MPVEAFEKLLADENKVDFRELKAREIEKFRIKDMFRDNVFSETMMNNILGRNSILMMFTERCRAYTRQ